MALALAAGAIFGLGLGMRNALPLFISAINSSTAICTVRGMLDRLGREAGIPGGGALLGDGASARSPLMQ